MDLHWLFSIVECGFCFAQLTMKILTLRNLMKWSIPRITAHLQFNWQLVDGINWWTVNSYYFVLFLFLSSKKAFETRVWSVSQLNFNWKPHAACALRITSNLNINKYQPSNFLKNWRLISANIFFSLFFIPFHSIESDSIYDWLISNNKYLLSHEIALKEWLCARVFMWFYF